MNTETRYPLKLDANGTMMDTVLVDEPTPVRFWEYSPEKLEEYLRLEYAIFADATIAFTQVDTDTMDGKRIVIAQVIPAS